MFTGFTDDTVDFFMDLKFHNNTSFFHEQHDRYVETVQAPFYAMIDALGPDMLSVDPLMEIRPHKCLSRIHRDTRFTRDKSPYRDHLWFLFRRAGEPRDKSLLYFGPDRLSWGMGIWGENRELMDFFRRKMVSNPDGILSLIRDMDLPSRKLSLGGTFFKRLDIPPQIPDLLKPWYTGREIYVSRFDPPRPWAFSERILKEVRLDFKTLAPLYRLLRGCADGNQ